MKYLAGVATLELEQELCTGCGMCAEVCPHRVLVMEKGKARVIDRDSCMECGACAKNCPSGAVTVQVGVGCAAAVINSALGRKSSCCSLDDYGPGGTECDCGGPGDGSPSPKSSRYGCC
jgi:NAD-dependent dihydropyrimidine dehydrogenase PreA subunit